MVEGSRTKVAQEAGIALRHSYQAKVVRRAWLISQSEQAPTHLFSAHRHSRSLPRAEGITTNSVLLSGLNDERCHHRLYIAVLWRIPQGRLPVAGIDIRLTCALSLITLIGHHVPQYAFSRQCGWRHSSRQQATNPSRPFQGNRMSPSSMFSLLKRRPRPHSTAPSSHSASAAELAEHPAGTETPPKMPFHFPQMHSFSNLANQVRDAMKHYKHEEDSEAHQVCLSGSLESLSSMLSTCNITDLPQGHWTCTQGPAADGQRRGRDCSWHRTPGQHRCHLLLGSRHGQRLLLRLLP